MKTISLIAFLFSYLSAFSQYQTPKWGISIAADFQVSDAELMGVGVWLKDTNYLIALRTDFIDLSYFDDSRINRIQIDGRQYLGKVHKLRPFAGISVEYFRERKDEAYFNTLSVPRMKSIMYSYHTKYDEHLVWYEVNRLKQQINFSITGGVSYQLDERFSLTVLGKVGQLQSWHKRHEFFQFQNGKEYTSKYNLRRLSHGVEILLEYQINKKPGCKIPVD